MARRPRDPKTHKKTTRMHISLPAEVWSRVQDKAGSYGGPSAFVLYLLGRYHGETAPALPQPQPQPSTGSTDF